MPIRRSPSVTGIEPASAPSMNDAACCTGSFGLIVWTSRVITSLTFMITLPLGYSHPTNGRDSRCRFLRHVLGQEVVGRYQLVLLVEDLDGPADLAGVLRLGRLGADG